MILYGRVIRWGVVAALAGVSLLSLAPMFAQDASAAKQDGVASLSIPPGPLEAALLSLGRQTNLKLVYPSMMTMGKSTAGAQGALSSSEALARILADTGLGFHFSDGNTVVLEVQPAEDAGSDATGDATILAPIQVRGTSAKPSDQPYETVGSSSYISAEQIERFRGSTAGDIFKNTPGVISANNHNGGAVNVNIRGLQGQNRVRVAIDGTQQTTTTWRGYAGVDDRTYVDPDLIGGVSVSKGPTGGAEGAGVNGGVVGIRTLSASDIVEEGNKYGGRLRVGAQDNTTSHFKINALDREQQTDAADFFDFKNGNGSIALATVQDNFDFVVAAARRYRGNYFAGKHGETKYDFNGVEKDLSFTKPGEEVYNTSSESSSLLAKGTWHIDDDQSFDLGYVRYESTYGEALPSLLFTQPQTYRQAALSSVATDTVTARYHYNPDDLVDLRVNAWMSIVDQIDISTGLAFYLPPYVTPGTRPPGDDPRYSRTHTFGGDFSNAMKFDTDYGDLNLSYGVSYLLEDVDSKPYYSRTYANSPGVLMNPSIGQRAIGSAFTQAEWEPTDWLKFNGGLRFDSYRLNDDGATSTTGVREKSGGRLNPSISATITPVDGLQFYALYSEGMRPPTMRETMGNDGNVTPNPNLSPELSQNWEVGINYMMDGLFTDDDAARFKISYFNNSYTDYISRVPAPPVPGMPVFTFENLRRARFSGIEVSGSYDVGPFFAQGQLTYYTGYEFCRRGVACSDTTVSLDYAANHMPPELMTSITLGTRLFEDKLTAGVRVTHAGERLSPITQAARMYTGVWNPYTVVDAFATYKVNDNVSLDLQAENLTDRFYVDALDGWNPSPGRTFRATLTAKF